MELTSIILPELIVGGVGCLLMLLGVSARVATRRLVPWIAFLTLLGVFIWLIGMDSPTMTQHDPSGSVRLSAMGFYIKLLTAGVGALLVLVSWPTNDDASGNPALNFGTDAGEFFGLMLLSLSGLMLVASANDLMVLFLAIELASLPTYIMVSVSRPLAVSQEAGVKYFFLGAMAAAVLLLGFTYLYGTTGQTGLFEIANKLRNATNAGMSAPALTAWQTMAFVIIIVGLAFKLAAVPFHTYVGDVYQGAATPVTAFLAFTPKATGIVALIKILYVASGSTWFLPDPLWKLVWWIAVLTMTFGNVLAVIQQTNVKRVLAYSSVAHSGYMLAGLAAVVTSHAPQDLEAVLFYLAAYALMNTGAFAVLTLIPARDPQPGTSAETFDDLAGSGRRRVALGLAMAISCFSLIGIPLTVGFFGKLFIIRRALDAQLFPLVVILVINAAVSAAYYLRIVGTMFLRPEPPPFPGGVAHHESALAVAEGGHGVHGGLPLTIAVAICAFGTLLFGAVFPATQVLSTRTMAAALVEDQPLLPDQPEGPGTPGTEAPAAPGGPAAPATPQR